MPLKYPGEWKFEDIGIGMPKSAVNEFRDLIMKIAGSSQDVIETFKDAFGSYGNSSSFSWAVSDMENLLEQNASNAVLFIDYFFQGLERAKADGTPVPTITKINQILSTHEVNLKITPPDKLEVVNSDVQISDVNNDEAEDSDGPVPKFILGEIIGNGGYGIVYKAIRKTSVSEFEFALKILDPSPFVTDYERALKRFQREIEALRKLQHRAIIQYYEAGITRDNKPYIVMPFVEGENLYRTSRNLDLQGVLNLFIEVLNALEYAHAHHVLHRDLKPSNIIVRSSDLQPVLLDFGCAYILDQMSTQTLTTQPVGTIGYIPSEILSDPQKRSHLQDIYACGIMLYEAFTGFRPDPANYKTIEQFDGNLGILDDIIQHAISGEHQRIQTAELFSIQLSEILQNHVSNNIRKIWTRKKQPLT